MILPLASHFAQNAADFGGGFAMRYAAATGFGNLQVKDATRSQDVISLHRDPFLTGRFGQSPVCPPQFFGSVVRSYRSKISMPRPGFAEIISSEQMGWPVPVAAWSKTVSVIRILEESITCKSINGLRWRLPLARSLPVVTRLVSKRLLGLGQAVRPLLSWNKMRLSGLRLVQPGTSPIARNIQNAADTVSGLFCVGLTARALCAGRSFCMPRSAWRFRATT